VRRSATPALLIVVAVEPVLNLQTAWLVAVMATLNLLMLLILMSRWQLPYPLLLVMGRFQMIAIITVNPQVRATEAADQLRRVNADLLTTRSLLADIRAVVSPLRRRDDIERAEALLRFAQEGLTNAARIARTAAGR